VVYNQGKDEVITSFPAERIDFDASDLPGLGGGDIAGLPCGQVEKRLLALVQLDPFREAGADRLDQLDAGVGFLTHSNRLLGGMAIGS